MDPAALWKNVAQHLGDGFDIGFRKTARLVAQEPVVQRKYVTTHDAGLPKSGGNGTTTTSHLSIEAATGLSEIIPVV